jgi:hypothetical protein
MVSKISMLGFTEKHFSFGGNHHSKNLTNRLVQFKHRLHLSETEILEKRLVLGQKFN